MRQARPPRRRRRPPLALVARRRRAAGHGPILQQAPLLQLRAVRVGLRDERRARLEELALRWRAGGARGGTGGWRPGAGTGGTQRPRAAQALTRRRGARAAGVTGLPSPLPGPWRPTGPRWRECRLPGELVVRARQVRPWRPHRAIFVMHEVRIILSGASPGVCARARGRTPPVAPLPRPAAPPSPREVADLSLPVESPGGTGRLRPAARSRGSRCVTDAHQGASMGGGAR